MRVHRLRLDAFGSFAGSETIDFDRLGHAGLFLLTGPTGAGKTTVLDAVGFALYGRLPGERDRAKRLRSDHAPAGVATEVQLDFTVAGRRFEVTRRPEQQRPKTRGAGMTRDPAKVVLRERVEARWIAHSTRVGEADQLLQRLLGMSARQFFQVVLLPQGDFARFLTGDAEERRQLLEKLFGTSRFAAVETWLREQVGTLRHALAALEQESAGVAERIAQVAGLACLPERPDVAWVEALQADVAVRKAEASVEAKEADAELQRRRAVLEVQLDLDARQARLRAALRRQASAVAAVGPDAEAAAELGAARRALAVAPALRAVEAGGLEANAAAETWRAARERVGVEGESPELRRRGRVLRDEAAAVRALEPLDDALLTRRRRLGSLDDEVAGLHRKVRETRRRQEEEPRVRASVEARLLAASAAAATVPGARVRLNDLERVHAAAVELDRCNDEVEQLRDDLSRAEQSRDELRSQWLDLREQRLDGIAGELACDLVDGEACPVCGSCEHPLPVASGFASVTREVEAASEAAFQDAAAAASDLAGLLAETRARRAAAAALAGDADSDEVAAQIRRISGELAKLEACSAGLASLRLEAERLEIDRTRLDRALVEDEAAVARASARRDEVSERVDQLVAEIDAARGEHPTVQERVAWLENQASLLEAAAEAGEEAARADRALKDLKAAAATAAAEGGFNDARHAAAGIRDAGRVEFLELQRKRYAADVAAVAALLAQPDLDVSLDEPADVPAARQAVEAAELAARAATARLAAEKAAHAELERLGALLEEAQARLGPAQQRADLVGALADLASGAGQNTLRMRLSAFVLAARLSAVAVAASTRLAKMSAGRYTLIHSDALAGGGRRSGLGLLVRDAWCGVDRDTATLSGGEAFLASLALALGLADVVTAEAGGCPIETLFVDEGFGSLDPETLDEVMDVLDGLREGNRVVGLVSHVPELRARISARVEVRKREHGSSLAVTGC
ncbi:MAG: AAA family ATPase [Frankiaceae bacterium]